ncbi:MAG TPA: PhzF family phenazine biosynthesis protein, partial [Pirellulales bacterium]|nr:PhzF family phenazine biosynthesis protein [Pirellulales bacterium]
DDERTLRAISPDFAQLANIDCRGVIVTARSDDHEFDFVSRFFAPAAGINEDSVTGSAHCTLAEFWRGRLHKSQFQAFQASRRGGVIRVQIIGRRVTLGGAAVLISEGALAGGLVAN